MAVAPSQGGGEREGGKVKREKEDGRREGVDAMRRSCNLLPPRTITRY